RYEARARFSTFLYQVARTAWLDQLRKARARPEEVAWEEGCEGEEQADSLPHPRLPPLRAPAATEPHQQLFLRYQQWRIREAIARLPEIYRIVFILGHLEECKIAEVA